MYVLAEDVSICVKGKIWDILIFSLVLSQMAHIDTVLRYSAHLRLVKKMLTFHELALSGSQRERSYGRARFFCTAYSQVLYGARLLISKPWRLRL